MNLFKSTKLDLSLVDEYFAKNEQKKQVESWLKKNKPAIMAAMGGAPKDEVGDYVVTVSTPNESKFDEDKLVDYLSSNGFTEALTHKVDEEALATCIAEGKIDIEDLKKAAWIEKKGTPRLSIKVKKADVDD